MKPLLLILITLGINGCTNDCDPVPCKKQTCIYPKFPTYKIPKSGKITPPILLPNGRYSFIGSEIKQCLKTNAIMRRACRNYAYINTQANKRNK